LLAIIRAFLALNSAYLFID